MRRSYHILLIFAIVIFILPFFFWVQTIGLIAFNVIVFLPDRVWLWATAAILMIMWLIYKLSRQLSLSRYWILIHVCITILGIGWIIGGCQWIIEPNHDHGNALYHAPQYTLLRTLLDSEVRYISIISWKSIVFLAAQLLFAVNISKGIVQRNKSRPNTFSITSS